MVTIHLLEAIGANEGSTMQVLDTSALLSWPVGKLTGCVCATSQVNELENLDKNRSMLIETVSIVWKSPSKEGMQLAKTTSQACGDLPRLSDVDLDILAVCFDMKLSGDDFTLFTDDYRVQNVARYAKFEVKSVNTKGVTSVWIWEAKCIGCRATSKLTKEPRRGRKGSVMDCEICGSEMKLKKKRG